MIVIDAKRNAVTCIGRLGENEARVIRINVSQIMRAFPGAAFTVLHRRPGDMDAYPVNGAYIAMDGENVLWTVASGDVEKEGVGQFEVVASVDGTIVKTVIYNSRVDHALDGSGDPPEPWESWQQQVAEDADRAEAAAQLLEHPGAEAETLAPGSSATAAYADGTFTFGIPQGEKGDQGQDGQDGQDGYSPTATVSKSGSTATITITDKAGTTTAQISDGQDGQPGQDGADGFSPIATVSKSGTVATISITDKNGTTTAEVSDGDPTTLIDDTAGDGDTDKAWSADKLKGEFGDLKSAINSRIAEPETEGTSGQVLTTDGNGGRSWTTVQGGGSVTVDDALSTTSTNPVQNKVITNAINSNILVNFIAKENLTEKGWRIQTNGKPTTTASYDASKFIPVKQGMIIKYGFYCSNIASPFAFYTTDQGNPEAYYAVTGTGVNSKTEGQYTIPSDGFIRFCSSNTKPDGYLYVTNMQPDYEKTYREETDTRIDGIEESLSNSLTGLTFNTGYVDADGSIHTQTANKEIVSEPIYCLGKIDLSLSFSSSKSIWIGIGVYGANGFISRKTYSETATSKSISYELPDGAMFIKISFRTFDETYSLVLNGQYSIPVVANNIESLFDKISDAGSPAILASSLKPCYDHLFVNTYGNNIVIPCQSIYHLRISKRLGYKTIEANIYESSDGVPFVHHLEDDGTLGRYFHHVDGVTDISDIVPSTKTAEWIVENVRYNSTIEKYRTSPVLLKDFLVECKKQEMIPFVTSVNTNVISMVSGIMGKDMFVAYRGSRTNCPTAIIYQWKGLSTKEDIVSYCDSVGKPMIYGMSNYNSFTDEQLIDIVETLHKKGYFIGAAYADSNWNKLSGMGFDFNGALWSANRIESGNLHNLESIFGFNDFTFTGATESGGILTFSQAGTLTPDIENKVYPLAMIDVELWFNGSVTFDAIGEMKSNLTITSDGSASVYRAIAIINGSTKFTLSVASGTEIYDIKFKASVC